MALKRVEPGKKKVKISDEDKGILEKYSGKDDLELSGEQRTVLEILTKRKTVNMILLEYNLALKPLGKKLMSEQKIIEILKDLKQQNLVKAVTGGDGKGYWIDVKHFREKLRGTERL